MKHIMSGLKVGLAMEDTKLKTFINVNVLNEKNGASKEIRFMIDTGFDGYLQLSKADASELGLEIIQKSSSALANGAIIETGITKTKIKILEEEISNFPIQITENAVALIGTQLLHDTNRMIVFDYEDRYVTLTRDKSLKEKIKSLVNENSK